MDATHTLRSYTIGFVRLVCIREVIKKPASGVELQCELSHDPVQLFLFFYGASNLLQFPLKMYHIIKIVILI